MDGTGRGLLKTARRVSSFRLHLYFLYFVQSKKQGIFGSQHLLVKKSCTKKTLKKSSHIDHDGHNFGVSLHNFSLELPNLRPVRKFMLPYQEVPDQPKKVRKASLKLPWKYQWICQHGALWWLGCSVACKTQGTVFKQTIILDRWFQCSMIVCLGLVMTLTQNLHISNGKGTIVMGAPYKMSPTIIFMVSIEHLSIHDE